MLCGWAAVVPCLSCWPAVVINHIDGFSLPRPSLQLITWLQNDPSGAPLIVLDEVRQRGVVLRCAASTAL